MEERFGAAARSAWASIVTLLKWLALALAVGGICGAAGAAFSASLAAVTGFRTAHPWMVFLLPVAGLLIVFLYRAAGMENDSGTNQIIASVRGEDRPPLRLAPLIFIASALTHLCGGSAGREGAALQIGGALASGVGRLFRLDENSFKTIIQCGMAGLFAALFGTPLAAAVFALEVVSVGIFQYSALFPCVVSALTAFRVTQLMGAEAEAFPTLASGPEPGFSAMFRVGVLAALAAAVSIMFCVLMHKTAHLYRKYLPNQYLRAAAGGLLVVALTIIEGSGDYNGAGTGVIMRTLEGDRAAPWAFALKMLFTAVTLGAGYRGGEIVPAFFVGATFGSAAAPLLGLDPAFGAALSMIAVFCGVVNCPMASLLLSLELFGGNCVLFFGLACAVSYLLSGKFSLYGAQKIAYSKLEPEFIDEHAR